MVCTGYVRPPRNSSFLFDDAPTGSKLGSRIDSSLLLQIYIYIYILVCSLFLFAHVLIVSFIFSRYRCFCYDGYALNSGMYQGKFFFVVLLQFFVKVFFHSRISEPVL